MEKDRNAHAGGAINYDLVAELIPYLNFAPDSAPDVWASECHKVHKAVEALVHARLREWRKRTKPRPKNWQEWRDRRSYRGGKSMWSLEYKESVRRLLLSWSFRSQEFGEKRSVRKKFASRLLQHIHNLKLDRIKSGADLIIQSALGFVPMEKGGWKERFKPCRLILFEDLSRYTVSNDQTKRENRMLMLWNHRAVLRETQMQGEVYGIFIDTVLPGYTSQYHAASGAPGVRCRELAQTDFVDGKLRSYVEKELRNAIKNTSDLKPGDLVPWDGGEFFITICNGNTTILNAEINAAQNQQRRFWLRYAESFRLPCVSDKNGGKIWYPASDGVLLRGGLSLLVGGSGYCRLEAADENTWKATGITKHDWRAAVGSPKGEDDFPGDTGNNFSPVDPDKKTEKRTFFRDPSGEFIDNQCWLKAEVFWARIKKEITDRVVKSRTY